MSGRDIQAACDERVRTSIDGPVATVRLAGPRSVPALDPELLGPLRDAITAAEAAPEVRVLVLRGSAAGFCVGANLGFFLGSGDDVHAQSLAAAGVANEVIRSLHESRLITVAAVNGACVGGGLALALACDAAVVADDANFSVGYVRIAATPDLGLTYFLTRALGYRQALELYLTSEQFGAERAHELGLVNRVVPAAELDAAVDAFIAPITAGPGVTMSEAKWIFQRGAAAALADQLELEVRMAADSLTRPEFREAVAAVLEKRPPVYTS